MHHIYHSDALVLAHTGVKEHDALIWLLTREHGLVYAMAQGIRKESSKLRYALREFSHVRVSLVRGRAMWRVVGALPHEQHTPVTEITTLTAHARVCGLIKALVETNEPDIHLFDVCVSGFALLRTNAPHAEEIFVARVLHTLGYMPTRTEYEALLACDNQAVEIPHAARTLLIKDINTALSESAEYYKAFSRR